MWSRVTSGRSMSASMSSCDSLDAARKGGGSRTLSSCGGSGLWRAAFIGRGSEAATVVHVCSDAGAAFSRAFTGSGRMSRSGAEGCVGRGVTDAAGAAGRRGFSSGCGRLPGSAWPEITAESPVKLLFFTAFSSLFPLFLCSLDASSSFSLSKTNCLSPVPGWLSASLTAW